MLTGTSEFPEERCKEKKIEKKQKLNETQRARDRAVPIIAAKGLSGLSLAMV